MTTPILPATAYIIASDAPIQGRIAAIGVGNYYGAFVGECDGYHDDVELQAAIDTLPDAGGSVVLSAGSYSLSTYINVNKPTATHKITGL